MSKSPRKRSVRATARSKITVNDLRRRWGKFDEVELAALKDNEDLVAQIQTKYSLSKEQARTNFDLWAMGRTF